MRATGLLVVGGIVIFGVDDFHHFVAGAVAGAGGVEAKGGDFEIGQAVGAEEQPGGLVVTGAGGARDVGAEEGVVVAREAVGVGFGLEDFFGVGEADDAVIGDGLQELAMEGGFGLGAGAGAAGDEGDRDEAEEEGEVAHKGGGRPMGAVLCAITRKTGVIFQKN